MMKIIKLLYVTCFLSAAIHSHAQDSYRKKSEEKRKQVWGSDMPVFKVHEIPSQYAGYSKVVLARHFFIDANNKSKLAFFGFGFSTKDKQTLNEVVREMVKLNDNKAVKEYSELSFTMLSGWNYIEDWDKLTTYIGFRVIKPDGSVKEINMDDIVLTKNEKIEKRARIAVPDLQPGDILDYFIFSEKLMTDVTTLQKYHFNFYDEVPILSFSFHAELDKKYGVEYRSYNAGPAIKISRDSDENIIIDAEQKNIPPFTTGLWVSAPRELPHIRIHIALGYRGKSYFYRLEPGEISKIANPKKYLDFEAKILSENYYNWFCEKDGKKYHEEFIDEAKKKATRMGFDFTSLSPEEKAAHLFYTLRFRLLELNAENFKSKVNIGSKVWDDGYAVNMYCKFKAAGLEPGVAITGLEQGYRLNEIMHFWDLKTIAYFPVSTKFFYLGTIFDFPFSVPSSLEGSTETKSVIFEKPGLVLSDSKKESLAKITGNGPAIPVSSYHDNAWIEKLKLSLLADKSLISVDRSTTLRGNYKAEVQKSLVLYEDLYESERKSFNEDKSLFEVLQKDKANKKIIDEVKNIFAEARKKQRQNFEEEVKNTFGQEVAELRNYRVDSLGIRHTSPSFVFSSVFNLGGMVKKAGNNIILEIGKIQGEVVEVKDHNRKRDIDIYMPFARSLEHEIELIVPEGFTVEGINALNTKVENEAGLFNVVAKTDGKTVSISIKKYYYHNFEPAKNWDKLLAILDESVKWAGAKILFKKK